MSTKTIILSFDMETDIGSWTKHDRGVKEGTPRILRVLEGYGVKGTFLFTGREAQNNPGAVERVLSDGHEVGCHTMFHETIGAAVFDMPGDNYILDGEVRGRLELATDTVEKIAGVRPVSFRAPRLFGSTAMINVLEDLGYRADSSFPAYFHECSFLPYRPSRQDWSVPGDSTLTEIPLFYDSDTLKHNSTDRDTDQWPMLRLKGGEWFTDLCRRMMSKNTDANGDSVLCVYLHPWEFVEMPATLETVEVNISFKPILCVNCGDYCLRALDYLIGAMKADGVRFARMDEFAAAHIS